MKSTYKFFLVAIAALMIATTSLTFGYWWSEVKGPLSQSGDTHINIGSGQVLETVFSVGSPTGAESVNLVPEGRVVEATDVTKIDLRYVVSWTPEDDAPTVIEREYIKITLTSIKNGNNDELIDEEVSSGEKLFDVTYAVYDENGTTQIDDKNIHLSEGANGKRLVIITVRLNEPKSFDQYKLVELQKIDFTITFALVETPLSASTSIY